ncbi:MAG: glycosyltransferase family 2 protein [Deltaproteobacteria bacterium]|nr:glycosyltransferase family 2 protein [Deltaproteobacteria bacterium]
MESLSIIIPAFNEESTLAHVVERIDHALAGEKVPYEIIVVDDGSTDATARVAEGLERSNLRVVRHSTNQGAGMAVRTGITAARHTLTMYVPADGQFDPVEIPRFVDAAQGVDIVIGYRLHRQGYGLVRKAQSVVFVKLANMIFKMRYRDLNWVHLWRRQTAGALPVESSGVFMQTELLVRARRAGMRIAEVPSEFLRRGGGKAKGSRPGTILRTLVEMIAFAAKGTDA